MTAAKYRRPLNSEQLSVLQWLYTYRFSTSKQLATYLHKPNHKAIQSKLQILEEQGYISKRYEPSYKLAGRAAEYFLTPKGARQLPADSVNEWALKSLYKDKTLSQDFVQHCLNLADLALQLQAIYGDKLRLFTRNDMAAFDYFPTWTPDLFLSFKPRTKDESPRRYFLDLWDETQPFFVSVRKARNYIKYAADDKWPDEAGDLPTILAICKDAQTQNKLNRQIVCALDGADDITFATTTQEQLEKATSTTKLWQKIDDEDEPARISL